MQKASQDIPEALLHDDLVLGALPASHLALRTTMGSQERNMDAIPGKSAMSYCTLKGAQVLHVRWGLRRTSLHASLALIQAFLALILALIWAVLALI